ncbi:YxiJ family protein [Thermaerobacillus caldiproteolyticus]|uniref:YxiJ-like protein n=1 Tax=Thermaerobacillus caldiproteolyticus TaxID=247480 RepID=A0A7V9Z7W1_9BACL|nr:YxiJ family protein [Anoxybacillus caldiproteolyticus]MBA2875578.1 hypothetical protein [Anoxybacillus caldiproteolyticus]
MANDNLLKQLNDIDNELHKPFPYKDACKIQKDFDDKFSEIQDEENCLTCDFDTYCMNIAGILSYVLRGKSKDIPKGQIEMLQFSFFELFNQYKFFEDKIIQYEEFYQEYMNYEKARKLLLEYLSE